MASYSALLSSPIGWLGLTVRDDGAPAELDMLGAEPPPHAGERPDPTAAQAVAWLRAYLAGEARDWTGPVAVTGTPFQERAWAALRQIPYGESRTYGGLARELGTGPRAIGGACRRNPLPIFIPCHRIVARQGYGGYSGATDGMGLATKRWLLRHEEHHAATG